VAWNSKQLDAQEVKPRLGISMTCWIVKKKRVLLLILCYAPNYRVVMACRGREDNAVLILGLGIVFIADVRLSNRRYHLSFPLKKVIPVEDLVLEFDTVSLGEGATRCDNLVSQTSHRRLPQNFCVRRKL
jgi:hypothetical protein